MLVASAAALAAAPLLMPAPYSWVSHTISESAAQGLQGAWLARLGFLLFGLAVLWLTSLSRESWNKWAVGSHAGFGSLLMAVAAFSHKPFLQGVAFDVVEEWLHSGAATLVGFAFAAGVSAVAVGRHRRGEGIRALDVAALLASVLIPLGMGAWPGGAGVLQRTMFVVAYVWYTGEAMRLSTRALDSAKSSGDVDRALSPS
jgi:hypothetical protein